MLNLIEDIKFKKKFETITSSIISLAFEYVNNDYTNVNGIYIFCSNEDDFIFFNVFFDINGKLLKKHRINDSNKSYDVSDIMQFKFSKHGTNNLRKLIDLFKKYKKEIPTQIKLKYFPKTGKFDCHLDYELHYSNKKNKTAHDIAESWFNSIKAKIEI